MQARSGYHLIKLYLMKVLVRSKKMLLGLLKTINGVRGATINKNQIKQITHTAVAVSFGILTPDHTRQSGKEDTSPPRHSATAPQIQTHGDALDGEVAEYQAIYAMKLACEKNKAIFRQDS